jgi:hypothetical protein
MTSDLIVIAWGTLLDILYVYETEFKGQRPLGRK